MGLGLVASRRAQMLPVPSAAASEFFSLNTGSGWAFFGKDLSVCLLFRSAMTAEGSFVADVAFFEAAVLLS